MVTVKGDNNTLSQWAVTDKVSIYGNQNNLNSSTTNNLYVEGNENSVTSNSINKQWVGLFLKGNKNRFIKNVHKNNDRGS